MSVLIYARRELVPLTGMGVEPPQIGRAHV